MNKVALVTGGNRGIGKDIALMLARNGIGVILTYRSNEQEALGVVREIQEAGGRSVALPFDLSAFARFDAFLGDVSERLQETFGQTRLDYLVNNAGFGKGRSHWRLQSLGGLRRVSMGVPCGPNPRRFDCRSRGDPDDRLDRGFPRFCS